MVCAQVESLVGLHNFGSGASPSLLCKRSLRRMLGRVSVTVLAVPGVWAGSGHGHWALGLLRPRGDPIRVDHVVFCVLAACRPGEAKTALPWIPGGPANACYITKGGRMG